MEHDSGSQNDCEGRAKEIQEVFSEIQLFVQTHPTVHSPEELEEFEKKIEQKTKRLAGLITGQVIQDSLASEEMQREALQFVGSWPRPMRNDGMEYVNIRTKSGQVVTVRTSYFRRKGKRIFKKRHPGIYPGLILLGIQDRCTPGLASDISLLAAAMASFEEVGQVLSGMGIHLDIKTIRSISYSFAAAARLMQQESIIQLGTVSGRRVVVSCDGGRIRIRTNKRGRKTKKNRNRYKTDWREPKLLIVYVVDAEGRKEQSFSPLIDSTLKGPDAMFALLGHYLSQLEVTKADRVLFVADGAPWIWKRLAEFIPKWGLKPDQVVELVDFFHAVEHLGKIAALRKGWSTKERKQWMTRHRRLLLKGHVSQVIEDVRTICRGRNSKEIRTQQNYFVKNAARMAYATVKDMKMPIGSGAVESAIRRVVNLRLKGAGIYWKEENAEAMLMLRSFFKAGRWNILKQMANPAFFTL